MKQLFSNIIQRSWGIMMSTSNTWSSIAAQNDTNRESFKQHFIPLAVACSVLTLIFSTLYADSKPIEAGFLNAILLLISYFAAFYFTRYISMRFFKKNHPALASVVTIEKIISYSFSVVILIKAITIVIPSLFFLQILNVYTLYVVWEASRVMWEIDEDERGKIMLLMGLSIMLAPAIVNKIIMLLIPGF
ncbi:MAG: hypothetical protein AUK44_07805 [Porphyromonadaceae bacterium CG2_30_38_12]|nr:MAG: hypothetical protein AUK44_07805 [Porphyromonadaceae bacterium CG2_30_38_12]